MDARAQGAQLLAALRAPLVQGGIGGLAESPLQPAQHRVDVTEQHLLGIDHGFLVDLYQPDVVETSRWGR